MRTYTQLFWNLLILAVTVSLTYYGWEGWNLQTKVKELENRPKITVGSDKELEDTVDRLEENLKAIAEQQFVLNSDPLETSRVIIARALLMDDASFLASLENHPRLSCTIDGVKPRAIVRLRSKNHVVGVGDTFAGYKVTEIAENQIRLRRNGRSQTLKVEAAGKDLAKRLAAGELDWSVSE